MLSVFFYRVMMLTAGTLYPAYRSYKAVRTKNVREYVKWMMYWIVLAIVNCVESVADLLLAFWCPFYYEAKIVFILWLISPWTRGASLMYRNWIHPWLQQHEQDIDRYLEQAKRDGYYQVMSIGQRGITCAREIVAQAALRGHEHLTQQLQRSYSMNDVGPRQTATEHRRPRKAVNPIVPEEDVYDDDLHSWAGPATSSDVEDPTDQDYNPPPRRSSRNRRGSSTRSSTTSSTRTTR
uniref:Receptor expression-enhancing protein n=1 Tax=Panagrellus redivivus TaxID=6233 RepID=A0A7E5A0B0_PANRE